MGRIRTIKPEFWTDEDLSELPPEVHMLAAALLNYADDEGYFNANPKLVKASCSPLRDDSVNAHDGLNMLSNVGYLKFGTGGDGKRYGYIVGFTKHQKVNRATPSKIKNIGISWDDSVSTHGEITEDSPPELGTGNWELGDSNSNELLVAGDADDDESNRAQAPKGPPPCPHQEIIALYHEILPSNPRIRDWTPARQKQLSARWREDSSRQDLDYWRRFFGHIAEHCPFLTGQRTGGNGKPFLPGLDWMVKAENFAKIREGRYVEDAA